MLFQGSIMNNLASLFFLLVFAPSVLTSSPLRAEDPKNNSLISRMAPYMSSFKTTMRSKLDSFKRHHLLEKIAPLPILLGTIVAVSLIARNKKKNTQDSI